MKIMRKEKFKKTRRGFRMLVIMVAFVMLLGSLDFNNAVKAMEMEKSFISTTVSYNDEKTLASIRFDMESVDKDQYSIISIISGKDGKVVYDTNEVSDEIKSVLPTYNAIENGSYYFTVKYSNKKNDKREIVSETTSESGTNQEEKIKVDVTGIKEIQDDIKLKEESNLISETSKKASGDVNENKTAEIFDVSRTDNANSKGVNLKNSFNLSGVAMNEDASSSININDTYYSINPVNKIEFGKLSETNYIRQTIALTSKFAVDYKKDFVIEGKANISGNPEGFAVAFHNDKNYEAKNSGGSLGVYRDGLDAFSKNQGVPEAVVVEVDTYNNDPRLGDLTSGGKHIGITRTYSDGGINQYKIQRIEDSVLNNEVDFKIEWKASENGVYFTFGGYSIELRNNVMGDALKRKEGVFTISTGVYESKNSLTIEDFRYTDLEPSIKTAIGVQSGNNKDYAISNEMITITHEIKNNIAVNKQLDDELSLKTMKIDGEENDLTISNIRTGTDKNNLVNADPGKIFDSNNPLEVFYPADSQVYYVQYDIKVPELENYGEFNSLNCEVLLGEGGMTQISSSPEKPVLIKNKPAVYTKKSESLITKSDIVEVENISGVTKESLWKELYAKVAAAQPIENKLISEQDTFSDMKVEWEYYLNGNKLESFPENIKKGNIYSLKVKITDKLDTRLNNEFTRVMVIKENVVQMDDYYIYAEDSKPVSETKLVTLTQNGFKDYVKNESKAKAFKINTQTGLVEFKAIDVNLTGWLDGQGNLYKLPGASTIELFISEKTDALIRIAQDVTENTWSYDRDQLPTENGASGFIVIPKGIDMEGGTGNDKNSIVGKGEIFFANYQNADSVKYNIYIDKTFEINKNGDSSNIVNVTTSSNDATDEGGSNRLKVENVGWSNHGGQEKAIIYNFKATRENVDKEKGRWEGNVTFYFERVS